MDLDEEVKKFHSLAAAPHLYEEFVASGCIEKLVAQVNHANPDIALDVVDLLRELTDADNNLDEEESQVLLKGLVSCLLFPNSLDSRRLNLRTVF